jgi:hypothetical protein
MVVMRLDRDSSPPQSGTTLRSERELVEAIQRELKRVGCDPGEIDGMGGDDSKSALALFSRHAKVSVMLDNASDRALDAVKSKPTRVCPDRPRSVIKTSNAAPSAACSRCAYCRRMNLYTGEGSVQMERCIKVCRAC